VGELRYQGERKGWDAVRTDTAVRTGLSDLYAGAVEAAIGQGLSINAAMKSGRVSPEAGATALENWRNGNVTIVTVVTGSARNGVFERIAGSERAVVYPKGGRDAENF